MKNFLVKCAKATVILLLFVTVCHAEVEFHNNRKERGGGSNMGLFPFPRVGRSDPYLTNIYDDLHESKRQGLMPFPRVGRRDMKMFPFTFPFWLYPDNLAEFQKKSYANTGGMWFGPRLGRLQKRSFDYSDSPWAYAALRDPSMKQSDYSSQMSRDSEEDTDDTVVEEILSRRLDSKNKNNISQQ